MDFRKNKNAAKLHKVKQVATLEAGKISRENYDRWRYRHPEYDNTQIRAKVPSVGLIDPLIYRARESLFVAQNL